MTTDERIASLEKQLQQALEQIGILQEQLAVAHKRIEELEKQKTPPPQFVKASVKKPVKQEKKPRKKRESRHNHGRRRAVPTQIVEHRIVECPDCHLRLGGITQARVREVIELAEPAPVEVIHHRMFQGWCAQCQKWHEAPVDLREQVLGQGRLGVRLVSLIATLRSVMRLPIRQIRDLLYTLHGVQVSVGEIVEVLHRLVTHAQPVLDDLKAHIRASSAVQADKTGWREDGLNGYVWSANTPTVHYYEYHRSRAGEVVKSLIGEEFSGVLGSDFYAGYNTHQGLHQRCWVHFLRDIHDLKHLHPTHAALWQWAKEVKQSYERAKAAPTPDPQLPPTKQHAQRIALAHAFEQEL